MASFGHIAAGVATARIDRTGTDRRSWVTAAFFWSLVSFLPDADVIGFPLGVRYEDEWGHRGASHSIAFAIALGVLIGILASRFRLPRFRTGVTATLVLISHGLLDTLTDGGLGIALFWPFDHTRYFAPWRPIPVAPIGLAFFSPYGLLVSITEAVMFGPVWWFALRRVGPAPPRRIVLRLGLLGLWFVGLWLVASDPSRAGFRH